MGLRTSEGSAHVEGRVPAAVVAGRETQGVLLYPAVLEEKPTFRALSLTE